MKSINHSSDRECATRSVSGETDETDETDEIPREEIRRDGRGMETVARNVAGGIARGLSDANGGGRRVGNETSPVRYVLDDVSDDATDETDETDDAREFYPLIFLRSARARERSPGRRRTT